MKRTPSLLIVSHDVVGSQMAGPGIRYYHLARILARDIPVTLAVPGHSSNDLDLEGVTLVTYQAQDWSTLAPLMATASVILLPSDLVAHFPHQLVKNQLVEDQMVEAGPALVIDGYNPLLPEWLAVHAQRPLDELNKAWQSRLEQQSAPIRLGDFFICASERQRDWWLGQLEAFGRINPATYQADPTMRQLIDVAPYGLPLEAPVATRPLIKGVWEGIATTDKVVLWGGGLWPWLDPLTAIHAIHKLATSRPEIKLIFPGTRHPNKDVATMPTRLGEAQALAEHYGLTGRQIFFGDWVAYPDWPNVLLESDVALTLHTDSLESRLAFRSRVLEYIWAAVPVVATSGDATSDLIAQYGLGICVRPNDAEAVAEAIVALLDEAKDLRAPGFAQAHGELSWERAVAPIAAFCRAPRRAADRGSWLVDSPQVEIEANKQIAELEAEVAYWRGLSKRYEQGRFMQAMSHLARLKRNVLGKRP